MRLSVTVLRGLLEVLEAEETGHPVVYRHEPPRVLACAGVHPERLLVISGLVRLPGATRQCRVWEITPFGRLVLAEWFARRGSKSSSQA